MRRDRQRRWQRRWLGVVLSVGLVLSMGAAAPEVDGAAPAVRYVYDALGRLVGVSDPAGRAVAYEYDRAGNLVGVAHVGADRLAAGVPGGGAVPVVSGVSPLVVRPGEQLRVRGENFTGDPLLDQVVLAGAQYATVESASLGELVVTAPPVVLAGPVSVATPAGTGHSEVEVFVSPWQEFGASQVPVAVRAEVGQPVDVAVDAAAGEVALVVFEGVRGDLVSVDVLPAGEEWLRCADVRIGLAAPDATELWDRRWSQDRCGGGAEQAAQLLADGSYALAVAGGGQGRTGPVRLLLRHEGTVEPPVAPLPPSLPAGQPGWWELDGPVAAVEPVWDGAGVAPVDLASGQLLVEHTDLVVDDVLPLPLTRSYQRFDARAGRPVPAFGVGSGLDFRAALQVSSTGQFADLKLPTEEWVEFARITPGVDAADALLVPTGGVGTGLAGARVVANGEGWDLLLEDGTAWWFTGFGGPLRQVRDRNGNTWTVEREELYLGRGNVLSVYSPAGRWLRFGYDDDGRVVEAWDHTGRTVAYSYDQDGLLAEAAVSPAGGGELAARVGYHYDQQAQVVAITGTSGEPLLEVGYDDGGRVAWQELTDGSRFEFAYTVGEQEVELGLPDSGPAVAEVVTRVEVTGPAGQVRRIEFAAGRWVSDTVAAGTEAEYAVSVDRDGTSGLVTSLVESDGRRTGFDYDQAGNLVSVTVTDPAGEQTTTSYGYQPDSFDLASLTDPAGSSAGFTYDLAGNLTSHTTGDGSTLTYTHDRTGRVTAITGPDGATVTFDYELAHRVTTIDPDGHAVSEYYDAAGRLAAATEPDGHTTRISYDSLDRPVEITDPAGGTTTVAYDREGNLASVTDPAGAATSYQYDPTGLVVARTDPVGAADQYVYDDAGRLVSHIDRRGVETTIDHDLLDRPTTITFGDESTIVYQYDEAGRLATVDDSAYGRIMLGYDHLDRVISETTELGQVTYTYDPAGRRNSMTLPDGTETSYTYDSAGSLVGINQPGAAVAATRNPAGRVTRLDLPGGITAGYTYDHRGMVTGITYQGENGSLGTLNYAHDPTGRQATVDGTLAGFDFPSPLPEATYDGANRLTRHSDASLVYDRAGHLIDDGTNTYTWDARGQLVAVNGPVAATFGYDPFGRRVVKTVDGQTTSYVYDGLNIAQQHDPHSTSTYLTGLTTDEVHARIRAGTVHTYLTDLQGSVVALADPAGTIATSYTYTPYGATTRHGDPDPNPYGFTSRELDETGLYHFRNRYYHPELGRFISEDPLGFDGGHTNLYTYAGGDPVNYLDPDGQQAIHAGACAVALGAMLGLFMDGFYTGLDLMDPEQYPVIDPSMQRSIELERIVRANKTALTAWLTLCSFGYAGTARLGNLMATSRIGSFGRGVPSLGRGPAATPVSTFRAPPPRTTRAPAGRACSFAEDTPVLMADGTTTAISDITTGDWVVATNPETGVHGPRQVTATWVHHDTLIDLQLADGGTITTTANHRFWNPTSRQWQTADTLQPGDHLHTPDGTPIPVTGLDHTTAHPGPAHNLTIDGLQTYYVVGGDAPALVHNTRGCWPGLDSLSESGMRPAKGGLTHAGREYQKHMARGELPYVPGRQLNTTGQDLLDDILTSPGTRRIPITGGNFQGGHYYIRPDGIGAAFDSSGVFQYFGRLR